MISDETLMDIIAEYCAMKRAAAEKRLLIIPNDLRSKMKQLAPPQAIADFRDATFSIDENLD